MTHHLPPEVIETEHPHIVRTRGVCGGRPHLRGTGMSVRTIAQMRALKLSAEAICELYPQLAPAAVYDAISYYFDQVL